MKAKVATYPTLFHFIVLASQWQEEALWRLRWPLNSVQWHSKRPLVEIRAPSTEEACLL